MSLSLIIKLCPLYYDTDFIKQTFDKLSLGTISSIDTEMVIVKERGAKGNKLYDIKKTYYKNVYITYIKINKDKAIIKKMFDQFSNDSYLIVHYSDDAHWKVYKADSVIIFKPSISFPIKMN
jgi:hypothetical protein